MSSLSTDAARTQIVELLDDTVYQALALKEALEEERKALEHQDRDSIQAAVDNKSACVAALQRLDRKRETLCQGWGFSTASEQMPKLIAWCDEDDLIADRWEHLMIIAAESSAINMSNGAIIRIRQQHFETSLSVLRGVMPGTDTYGRHGEETGDYNRRSLAEA